MDEKPEGAGTDFAGAVVTARELIDRLAGTSSIADAATASALRDARDVLARLAPSAPLPGHDGQTDAGGDPEGVIVLDVSDLLGYFENNRLPTGIQRVQTELILNVLQSAGGQTARLCCFVPSRNQWVTVERTLFADLCAQSRTGGDPLEPRWVAVNQALRGAIGASPAQVFPQGAVLVNIGSSWWLPDYFLYVRQAKIASRVRYVPLIYDLIPALTPENCDPALVKEFIGWIVGVLDHADDFLAISEATRTDLMALAERLGRPIAPERIAVIPLDADFRGAEAKPLPPDRRFAEPFVLFVSTLEARKNQLGALDAWASLIARHGPDRVPRLVLVGKEGFKSGLVLARREGSTDLRERVTILSGIEDVELQALYRDCLFTLYPSYYEGWGLPVTESLCYGKVPLVADNSSLPEAGGASALYFKTGSTVGLVAALERLIFEPGVRERQEEAIRATFRPRSWSAIAGGMVSAIDGWVARTPTPEWPLPVAQAGAYYPMQRNRSSHVWKGMGSAEGFRHGSGWFSVEDRGCWTRPGGSDLAFRLAAPDVRRLGFELICPARSIASYRIELVGHDAVATGRIEDGPSRWAYLDLPEGAAGEALRIRFTTSTISQPELGWAGDFRRLGVGLRGMFVFGGDAAERIDFIEAAALGALPDYDFYRDRSLDPAAG